MAATAPAPLLSNDRFVRFSLAKLLQLAAQNALVYGLFILLVGERESALLTSAFVLTAIVPSVFLSLPGGVVADALPRKLTIVWTMAARIGVAWWFLQQDATAFAIISLAFASWTVYQFFRRRRTPRLRPSCRRRSSGRRTRRSMPYRCWRNSRARAWWRLSHSRHTAQTRCSSW